VPAKLGLLCQQSWACCASKAGLVVPAKFTAFTTELHIARILDRELNGRVVKYNHFELKNVAFDEKKFPVLFQKLLELLCSGFFSYMVLLE